MIHRTRAARGRPALAAFAVAILLGAGTVALGPIRPTHLARDAASGGANPVPTSLPNPSKVPISHFVIVTLENHAYDNYFGTYCTSIGTYCSMNATGLPAGTCVPKLPSNHSAGCIVPYNYSALSALTTDPPHTWATSHTAYDNGSMDGFYLAANQNPQVFGHFNGSTIPVYWDLAEEYGLADHFFSSVMSFSLPEHWDEVAQNPPKIAVYSGVGGVPGTLTWEQEKYLNEANATPSIEDVLLNTSLSWKYYDYALTTYHRAVNTQPGGCTGGNGTFNYWNPLAARAESYNASFAGHFVDRSRIFADLKAGSLPNVSWVIPDCIRSDHPGAVGSIAGGQHWVANLVDALENSTEWNSTALFLTWDEFGGFYDHVPPPQVNPNGFGFRVPFLVVSAYARENFVSHVTEYFQSYLHLIEWRFGITRGPGIHAPLPLEYFNFSAPPRAPMNFGSYPNASYPIPLQSPRSPGAPVELGAVRNSSWEPPMANDAGLLAVRTSAATMGDVVRLSSEWAGAVASPIGAPAVAIARETRASPLTVRPPPRLPDLRAAGSLFSPVRRFAG